MINSISCFLGFQLGWVDSTAFYAAPAACSTTHQAWGATAETAASATCLATIGFFNLSVVALISLAVALIVGLVASLGIVLAVTCIVLSISCVVLAVACVVLSGRCATYWFIVIFLFNELGSQIYRGKDTPQREKKQRVLKKELKTRRYRAKWKFTAVEKLLFQEETFIFP